MQHVVRWCVFSAKVCSTVLGTHLLEYGQLRLTPQTFKVGVKIIHRTVGLTLMYNTAHWILRFFILLLLLWILVVVCVLVSLIPYDCVSFFYKQYIAERRFCDPEH